jgi:hypothetical protein
MYNLTYSHFYYLLTYLMYQYKLASYVIWYSIYLLIAIGLTPSGSTTAHIYTQTVHRIKKKTEHKKQLIEHKNIIGTVWAVPRLCDLYPGIYLTTEEKARKNLSQGSWTIRTHRPNNKNT